MIKKNLLRHLAAIWLWHMFGLLPAILCQPEVMGWGNMAGIDVEFTAENDADIAGAYLRLDLLAAIYSGSKAVIVDPAAPAPAEVSLAAGIAEQNEYLRAVAGGARFLSTNRQLEILFNEPTEIVIRDDRRSGNYDLQVYMAVISGKAAADQSTAKRFSFTAKGEIDREPVELTLDASSPGQAFDGLGGNFRIQNPKTDPAVIRYNLDGMRVSWGRVEMPWYAWDPMEDADPLETARGGKLNDRVGQAMEMARELVQRGMPVIVSAWFGPSWAILGQPNFRSQPGEPRGNPLNPEKMGRIAESITGYLLFLKEWYGVEAVMFSFNESDLGINIRQTAREHAELIKILGRHFAANGIYAIHIVNNGAARPAAISGLPSGVKLLNAWITDSRRGMQEGSPVSVSGGKAEFTIDAVSFMTLMNSH